MGEESRERKKELSAFLSPARPFGGIGSFSQPPKVQKDAFVIKLFFRIRPESFLNQSKSHHVLGG